jgi:hypothetical protein
LLRVQVVLGMLGIAVCQPAHDGTAVRLAVLQAAASFLGQIGQCRQEVRSEHVLVLAERWLAWVERAEAPAGTGL